MSKVTIVGLFYLVAVSHGFIPHASIRVGGQAGDSKLKSYVLNSMINIHVLDRYHT